MSLINVRQGSKNVSGYSEQIKCNELKVTSND